MTLPVILQIGCTSILFFLATFIGSWHLLQLWDVALKNRLREPVDRYLQLRMSEPVLTEGLRLWSISMIAAVIALTFYARAYPLAALCAFIGSAVPPYVLESLIRRREWLLESQLIPSATGLGNALKAGLSIPQAMKTVADEAPFPLSVELSQISYQFEHGRPMIEALSDTRRRLSMESFTLFCLALEVACERSGRVNVAMSRLSSSLQEWFRLRRKIQSDTASGRYAVLIMSMCPFAFILLFLAAGQSQVLFFFNSLWGQVVLSIIILLICFAVKIAGKILDIKIA